MFDSIWFWLYMLVGFALCVTNTISVFLKREKYRGQNSLMFGLGMILVLAIIWVAWPLVLGAMILGVAITGSHDSEPQ